MDSRSFSLGCRCHYRLLVLTGLLWTGSYMRKSKSCRCSICAPWNPCDEPKGFYQPEPHSVTKTAFPFIPEEQEITSKCSQSRVLPPFRGVLSKQDTQFGLGKSWGSDSHSECSFCKAFSWGPENKGSVPGFWLSVWFSESPPWFSVLKVHHLQTQHNAYHLSLSLQILAWDSIKGI